MNTITNKKKTSIEEGWAMSVNSLFFNGSTEKSADDFELPKVPVIAGKMIIEFHKGGISPEEFANRNVNYEKMGYRTAWVFDVSEEIQNRQLISDNIFDSTQRMLWEKPYDCLVNSTFPQDTDKNYAVYLVLGEPGPNMELRRIIWSSGSGSKPDYKHIMLSPIGISFQDVKNPEVFFFSKRDWMVRELKRHPVYAIKKVGAEGFNEQSYICGKRNSRGIKIPGADGCEGCRFCAATERLADKGSYNVYCCYPNPARVPDGGKNGAECSPAEQF